MNLKKIGVLTSGGDAPGMNAAIRSVVRTSIFKGISVVGIKRGYNGLINGDFQELNIRDVSDIIHKGGTVLYTARCKKFTTEEGMDQAVETCKKNGIEGIVAIGGDGTFRGAGNLAQKGILCTCIPATIDNDIVCSDYSIGFDTALNTAMEMIDKLRDTSQSHDRCTIVEVMGRRSGNLALETGVSCGATFIIVPEIPNIDIDANIVKKIKDIQLTGKKHFIIVVGEGYGKTNELSKYIAEKTNMETRVAVLGHVQRGGDPSVRDRVIATHMGNYAVNLLTKGMSSRVIAINNNKIIDLDINEALQMHKDFNYQLYDIAQQVSS